MRAKSSAFSFNREGFIIPEISEKTGVGVGLQAEAILIIWRKGFFFLCLSLFFSWNLDLI